MTSCSNLCTLLAGTPVVRVLAPLLPGAATSSDVMALLERGHSSLKFFSAEPAEGVANLKALVAPLPEARFCPTGGIDAKTAPGYQALPNVLCVGGSWVAPGKALAAGHRPRITALARAAAALAGAAGWGTPCPI